MNEITKITNEGILSLQNSPNIAKLFIKKCGLVTNESIQKLKQQKKILEIYFTPKQTQSQGQHHGGRGGLTQILRQINGQQQQQQPLTPKQQQLVYEAQQWHLNRFEYLALQSILQQQPVLQLLRYDENLCNCSDHGKAMTCGQCPDGMVALRPP